MFRSVAAGLCLAAFITFPVLAQDATHAYEQELGRAIAEIDRQSQTQATIRMPVLRSTGSAMHDQAANILVTLLVELRNEQAQLNLWIEADGGVEADYRFLADSKLIAKKYSRLDQLKAEGVRHLIAVAQIDLRYQNSMVQLLKKYGEQAVIFSDLRFSKMSIASSPIFSKMIDSYANLITFAHSNAGKIEPTPDGLAKMPTEAETMKLLALIKDVEELKEQLAQAGDAESSTAP